jgi:hypothetical protein
VRLRENERPSEMAGLVEPEVTDVHPARQQTRREDRMPVALRRLENSCSPCSPVLHSSNAG